MNLRGDFLGCLGAESFEVGANERFFEPNFACIEKKAVDEEGENEEREGDQEGASG